MVAVETNPKISIQNRFHLRHNTKGCTQSGNEADILVLPYLYLFSPCRYEYKYKYCLNIESTIHI